MKRVLKYPILLDGKATPVTIPAGAILLPLPGASTEADFVPLYVEVTDQQFESGETFTLHFRIFGTGHPIPESDDDVHYHHYGSMQAPYGLVWHIYQVVQQNPIAALTEPKVG